MCNLRVIAATFNPKPRKKPEEGGEEEMPENRHCVSDFVDTECQQGEQKLEDEPVEESLQELLFFEI